MKKIITTLLVFMMLFGTFTVTANAASTSGGYVRVKKATYQKYQKAYKENKKLKTTIKQQKKTIKSLKASLAEAKSSIEDKDSMNSWLWMNVKSMGLSYNDKTWTIPADIPNKFVINGTTYYVVKEGE